MSVSEIKSLVGSGIVWLSFCRFIEEVSAKFGFGLGPKIVDLTGPKSLILLFGALPKDRLSR